MSKWCNITEPKIAGDGLEPKTRQVNQNSRTSLSTSLGFFNHKNLKASWSSGEVDIIKKAFSVLAVDAIKCHQNLIKVSNNLGIKFGPALRQLSSEMELVLVFAEPS